MMRNSSARQLSNALLVLTFAGQSKVASKSVKLEWPADRECEWQTLRRLQVTLKDPSSDHINYKLNFSPI